MTDRLLTADEKYLVKWMLENGEPEAAKFLEKVDELRVTPWRCPCGCASFNFSIETSAKQGMKVVADFLFGNEENLSGIFAFEYGGELAGIEIYGLAGDAPKILPKPEVLRPADFKKIQ